MPRVPAEQDGEQHACKQERPDDEDDEEDERRPVAPETGHASLGYGRWQFP
jgi:hypothetical protein